VASAIRAHDTGFASVDQIPLEAELSPPAIVRSLQRLAGLRGVAAGLALGAASVLLITVRGGVWLLAILLFGLGLVLRAAHLDLPFVHDQDVQRIFTAGAPLREIVTGVGLRDRRPPLYFLLLHAAEHFGQSESVVRAPAVVAGALIGPAVLWAGWTAHARVSAAAALAALAMTISAELIGRSREVSEIPLFALLAIAACGSLARAVREPRWSWLALAAITHGLLLWTYYLAPLVIAGEVIALAAMRGIHRRARGALAAGILGGLPTLLLAAATFLRDRGAREAARLRPGLAWGERTPGRMAGDLWSLSLDVLDPLFLVAVALVALRSIARRQADPIASLAALVATALGIVLLTPVARMQAYYLVAVLPLGAAAVAAFDSDQPRWNLAVGGLLAASIATNSAFGLAGTRSMYLADPDAFGPAFAQIIRSRPERDVVVTAHYDGTLLAYYLCRATGTPLDWSRLVMRDDAIEVPCTSTRIIPLVQVHQANESVVRAAASRLAAYSAQAPVLVVHRESLPLPGLGEVLRRCETLAQTPSVRLLACGRRPPATSGTR
jgi:hypothetical protein